MPQVTIKLVLDHRSLYLIAPCVRTNELPLMIVHTFAMHYTNTCAILIHQFFISYLGSENWVFSHHWQRTVFSRLFSSQKCISLSLKHFILVLWMIFQSMVCISELFIFAIYSRVPARQGLQQTRPGLQAATRHGVRDPLVRSSLALTTYKNFKKKTDRTFDPLFTKTGWTWHVTIYC